MYRLGRHHRIHDQRATRPFVLFFLSCFPRFSRLHKTHRRCVHVILFFRLINAFSIDRSAPFIFLSTAVHFFPLGSLSFATGHKVLGRSDRTAAKWIPSRISRDRKHSERIKPTRSIRRWYLRSNITRRLHMDFRVLVGR